MSKKRGFTLIELLVVIAIIALLMSILMPTLAKVRKLALLIACQARLKQWSAIFSMYTNDNNGMFHLRGGVGGQAVYLQLWPYVYKSLYQERKMRYCPAAENDSRIGGSFGVYPTADYGDWNPYLEALWAKGENAPCLGSYGINRYVVDMRGSFATDENYWRKPDYKGADKVPVFMDAMYVALWGFVDALPPEYDGDFTGGYTQQCACISRHCGYYINVLFMDWTVKKIGLKQLWTLKWSKGYDEVDSVWTVAGNGGGSTGKQVCKSRWDQQSRWLRKLPVY
jgi:prepilin-type N-terminal cleavage/methylation domain-containing protein